MIFVHIRYAAWASLLWVGAWVATAQAAPAALPSARFLDAELATALQSGQPLVVMVSLEGCPFCRIARQSHLAPMHRRGFVIVQVDMRSTQSVRDLEGRETTHDALIQRWKVSLAPTLLFLGPDGKELADRMEGAYQPDFYGPYLDERIEKARERIHLMRRRD